MSKVQTFYSTDGGAPTLSGTAGDLTNLLDKILVDGYNTKTVTITRSGTVATANCTAHGFRTGQWIIHSGANETDYNIAARITVSDANNYTYTVANAPATPATGTISAKVESLGWSTAYTATNKRAYRQKTGTNQFYLRITDDGTGSAYYARAVGYEAMTTIDAGTNPFPTEAQQSGGLYWHKSSTANATARPWRVYSNGKIVYLTIQWDSTNWIGYCFGDLDSQVAGDAYATIIIGSMTGSQNSGFGQPLWNVCGSNITGAMWGNYMARGYAGTGGSTSLCKYSAMHAGYSNQWGMLGWSTVCGFTYPSPAGGGIYSTPIWIIEDSYANGFRGVLPGIWGPIHANASLTNGDTFTGATGSPQEGKSFYIMYPLKNDNSSAGTAIFETSDTW